MNPSPGLPKGMADAPLPPPPLLAPLTAAVAGLASLAGSLWGFLNQRRTIEGYPGDDSVHDYGENYATVRVTGSEFITGGAMKRCSDDEPGGNAGSSSSDFVVEQGYNVKVELIACGVFNYNYVCQGQSPPPTIDSKVRLTNLWGQVQTSVIRTNYSGGVVELGSPRRYSDGLFQNGVRNIAFTRGGVPFVFPSTPDPFVDPQPLPEKAPLIPPPLPLAPSQAPPLPLPGPGDPLAEPKPEPGAVPSPLAPGTGTGTGTAPGGGLLPLRPPIVFPVPPPVVAPPTIDTGTAVPPVVVVTPPVTPPGTEVTPDGVIGQPGTPPPPTLVGIAAEVGRIEQKTRQLLDRPAAGVDIQALIDALLAALQPEADTYPAGSYVLNPVCERRPAAVASWPEGEGAMGLVNAKLNALAVLLQAHKNFRQPICATKASGQPVTVQFQQIE